VRAPCGRSGCALPLRYILRVKWSIYRKPDIYSAVHLTWGHARVCLFAGSAVNNIVNNKNTTKYTKNGSKLYFKILKTWKNWESTRITSIPFPFLRTSFPIPSGQIPTWKYNFHVLSRTSHIYAFFEKNMRVSIINIILFRSPFIVQWF
jgi:hypothetical protein